MLKIITSDLYLLIFVSAFDIVSEHLQEIYLFLIVVTSR